MITKERAAIISLAVMALFYSASGISLYFFPQFTFEAMPEYYGAFNIHFIKDAGLAFLASGVMLIIAVANEKTRFTYSLCGALFVVLHGIFHLKMLFGGMIPRDFYSYEGY